MKSGKDFRTALYVLNNTTWTNRYSPTKLFIQQHPRTDLPDISIDIDFDEGVHRTEKSKEKMHKRMQKSRDSPSSNI